MFVYVVSVVVNRKNLLYNIEKGKRYEKIAISIFPVFCEDRKQRGKVL